MEHFRFPAWQTMCVDALRETNPKYLRDRVKTAERAILLRAQQIENSTTDNDEKLAINEALKSLRHLKGISEWL
jgi:predicted outer membrane protein